MAAISETTFSNALSWMKIHEYRLIFHCLKNVLNVPINDIPILVQVMTCFPTTASHYLSQSWLIMRDVLWHSHEDNFTGNPQVIYPWYEFENAALISQPHLPWAIDDCSMAELGRTNSSSCEHYSAVIMNAMVSQITSLMTFIQVQIKENWKFRVTGLCEGNSPVTGEFPAQWASNEENVSIWWRHHEIAPRWMLQDPIDDMPTLVQAVVWCWAIGNQDICRLMMLPDNNGWIISRITEPIKGHGIDQIDNRRGSSLIWYTFSGRISNSGSKKLWQWGIQLLWILFIIYSISQEICTRFCCALLCCGYAIVHNEFTWSIYPYSSGLLCWHWGNR